MTGTDENLPLLYKGGMAVHDIINIMSWIIPEIPEIPEFSKI